MKALKATQAIRFLLSLALAFACCPIAAMAQNNSPSSPVPANNAAPVPANKVRSRRVAPGSTAEKVSDAASGVVTEKSGTEPSNENQAANSAEVIALRTQINAAPTAQERASLQLKLVDQFVATGLKQQAIAELHGMGGENRFDPQGFYNIGNALARLGDADGAIIAYRKAIDQRKGRYSRACNNLGVVLLSQGRWEEADEAFLSALRLENFRYAEASYNLGRLYAARGENDLAVREWQRALKVNPEHTGAAQAIAGRRLEGRITVASLPPASKAVANKPGTSLPIGKSPEDSAANDLKKGARAAPPAITVDEETYGFLQRARSAREHGRNEEAVENYRRVITRMGGYFPPANLELSYALITLKRSDEAIATLQTVSKTDGQHYPLSYFHLGRLYELKGELKLAQENYQSALAWQSEGNAQFLLDLSRVQEKLSDFQGALASMEEYLRRVEQQGQKPEWFDERLASLRRKLSSSQSKPKP